MTPLARWLCEVAKLDGWYLTDSSQQAIRRRTIVSVDCPLTGPSCVGASQWLDAATAAGIAEHAHAIMLAADGHGTERPDFIPTYLRHWRAVLLAVTRAGNTTRVEDDLS